MRTLFASAALIILASCSVSWQSENKQDDTADATKITCGYTFDALESAAASAFFKTIEGVWYSGAGGAAVGRDPQGNKFLYRDGISVSEDPAQFFPAQVIMIEQWGGGDPYVPSTYKSASERIATAIQVGPADPEGFRIVQVRYDSTGTLNCSTYAMKIGKLPDNREVLLFKGPLTTASTKPVPVAEFFEKTGPGSKAYIRFER